MTYNEIEACVIRAKTGNQEDLLKILEQYRPFILKIARGTSIKSFDTYDLLQIGYIAVINAVAKYKTGSHTFSTYAYSSIKNAFNQTARKNMRHKGDLSLNTPVYSYSSMNSEFIDCIDGSENLEETILKSVRIEELRSAVAKLSEDEVELVVMVYFSGASLKTYAEKKQLGYFAAFRKRNKILEKLREYIML